MVVPPPLGVAGQYPDAREARSPWRRSGRVASRDSLTNPARPAKSVISTGLLHQVGGHDRRRLPRPRTGSP